MSGYLQQRSIRYYRKPLVTFEDTKDGRVVAYLHPNPGFKMSVKRRDADDYIARKLAVHCPFDPRLPENRDRAFKLAGIR